MKPTVLIFVQTGCGHCDEFMTRFKPIADPYYAKGLPIQVGDIANSSTALRLADRYKVEATPTTIGHSRRGEIFRLEGAVSNAEIKRMLDNL